jgi:hypothetical protein
MKIFIGSSTKKKHIAKKIAIALEGASFQVLRWWDHAVFKGGDVTIDRLIEVSDVCDGAVFVFGADDTILTTGADGRKELAVPRDNVVLEYGIFVGKHGRKKTLFVPQPRVQIPTDLLGVTHLGDRDYVKKIIRGLKDAFGDVPTSQIANRVTIHLSRSLINRVRTGIPSGWYSRALYIGSRGANAWAAVENDQAYSGSQDFSKVRELIERLAKRYTITNFDCIVSFGPGLGHLDKAVLPTLRGIQMVQYIPVDINDYLAVHSAEEVDKASQKTHIPFCIVADFEDEMSVIADIINEHTSPGRVFMMLGGTFGNLENGEDAFLQGLYDCMKPEDVAILDVFTSTDRYKIDSDPYRDINALPSTVKRFLAGGVERRSGQPITNVIDSIADHIESRAGHVISHVPKTASFAFCCKPDMHPLIYVRRYDFEAFKKHLGLRGFLVIAGDSVGDLNKLVHRSVYFLKKS